MRLIISPAKNMRRDLDGIEPAGLPRYVAEAGELLAWMRAQTAGELQRLWGCNDALAALNAERVATMDLRRDLTPAVLAYDGIQYKYMAPAVFEERQLAYVQEHLRILSGLYGALRALDGVAPYRLEMQAKAHVGACRDLYEFWGRRIYDAVVDGDRTVVNLASKEYALCVERYLQPDDTYVTCVFGELAGGRVVQKGTYAKMARGEMVRFAADVDARRPQDLKAFDRLGYRFDEARSNDETYVFVK